MVKNKQLVAGTFVLLGIIWAAGLLGAVDRNISLWLLAIVSVLSGLWQFASGD